jgi:TolB-like protein
VVYSGILESEHVIHQRLTAILVAAVVFLTLLWPDVGDARRRRRRYRRAKRVRVAVVPIAGTGRAARKLAYKLTRKLVRKLKRNRRRRVVLLSRRRVAKLRRCLQEPDCVRGLGRKLRAKYIVAGHIMRVRRAYHVDLAVISVELGGVATSRSFRTRSAWKVVSSGSARIARLLRAAPKAARKALAAKKAKRDEPAPKPPEDPPKTPVVQVDQGERPDVPKLGGEDPKDPKKVLAEQRQSAAAAPQAAGEPTFFSSVLAKRYWAGWLALGAGVAALGAGVGFGVISSGAASDAKAAEEQVEAWTLRDKAEKNALTANIMFGVAGGAVIAASVLFYLEYRSERAEHRRRKLRASPSGPRMNVDVGLAPSGATLGLRGTF